MEITFERRFRGPLTSANGGYACGRIAAYVDAEAVEVTLRLPPPLERPLAVRRDGDCLLLLDGDAVVAEARPADLGVEPPEPASRDEAEAARERHVHLGSPEFRECYVCGDRSIGDGLAIHAGAVPGREPLHAAPWTPSEVGSGIVWAAIDCPGAYAVGAEGRGEIVLGRMTASVFRVPTVGEPCIVTAWPEGDDGRKVHAGTALFGEGGELLALARQVWIAPRPTEA